MEGGTLVTIEGSNLGLREEDVLENVYIGDVPCEVVTYHVSVKILCRAGEVPYRTRNGDMQFPVKVSTPAGTTVSTVKFTYTVMRVLVLILVLLLILILVLLLVLLL